MHAKKNAKNGFRIWQSSATKGTELCYQKEVFITLHALVPVLNFPFPLKGHVTTWTGAGLNMMLTRRKLHRTIA